MAQLVSAEAEDVMQASVGALQIQCVVQLALAAQHAGRQFVRESAIPFGESGEVAIARVGERRSRPHRA